MMPFLNLRIRMCVSEDPSAPEAPSACATTAPLPVMEYYNQVCVNPLPDHEQNRRAEEKRG
ncbi:hypothetical protein E2C01_036332 [Portunus trituberculatus]|uniref:Uncharacterized protein n=1 Tax=Portunus trituberculatus TaxID=210409 RepID=A0A5B7FB35_PORTR|nr:hypothetical protein [Portunus trituberculatus]